MNCIHLCTLNEKGIMAYCIHIVYCSSFLRNIIICQKKEKAGFELITDNSNSNTFDVSLLLYYITNNWRGCFKNIQLS